MKLIENLKTQLNGKWLIRYGIYECPRCSNHFKANVSDVKRNRVRHCGCSKWNRPLPEIINGYKISQDLGIKNGRKRATVFCPLCFVNTYEVSVDSLHRDKIRKNCGCIKSQLQQIKILVNESDIIKQHERIIERAPLIRLKNNIRALIRKSIWKGSYTKDSSTERILGCNFNKFKTHIENLFTDGMNWNNRDKWHIDHIIPCDSAKNKKELIKLNHYTNLQPLWAIDNIRKSNKIV
jgi:hypothetical protein